MDIAHTPAVERIARVLTGMLVSANGEGDNASASDLVDRLWRDHVPDALCVLRTLREPSEAMAAAGDVAVWERMILAAIKEAEKPMVVL
ncbi:hypothetical protein [Sphingomonas endolithica]|uniref:hypothetical protein n=1 Tax=Sphingomonas endolithica TaxID=2972485 RepID=UPI0021AF20EB|nr:hypothetical protein [Sphingomonas sp. ZFBP2030]